MSQILKLAAIFSHHMVLCRNQNIRIFGQAQSGQTVTVSIHDHTVSSKAVKGEFMVTLPPMEFGGPYTLTVTDGASTLRFTDIMIGDVYFAGGQSNMEMPLKDTQDAENYIAQAEYPSIRYCNYPVQGYLDDKVLAREQKTKWKVVKPGSCGDISAVAFHFATKLHAALQIPIGIIDCYLGGTSIVSWLEEDVLCAITGGKDYWDAFNERIKDQTDEQYQDAYSSQQRAHANWNREAEAIKKDNPDAKWEDFIAALGPCPWPPPEGKKSVYRPCGLVNTMVKRIAPYSLTGILYYQGESDYRHPHLYRALMMALIVNWRDIFASPSLPFLFVQLPMFDQQDEDIPFSWPLLRHAQEQVHQDMRHTGLAVTIDCGDKEDIHPKDKKTVGERLFQQALQIVYHQSGDNSPRATYARCDGNRIVVSVSSPLIQQNTPLLFEVAEEEDKFYTADAVMDHTKLYIQSPHVAHPRYVRYAWVNYDKVNMFGLNGLPLAPFYLRG